MLHPCLPVLTLPSAHQRQPRWGTAKLCLFLSVASMPISVEVEWERETDGAMKDGWMGFLHGPDGELVNGGLLGSC